MNKKPSFVFFGTGPLAESVLAALVRAEFVPKLIVTKPDSLQGRHMQLTAPHIKTWAQMKGISVYQPETLKELPLDSPLYSELAELFIVASYGKIIPEEILNIPKHGVLNVHPSLLPLYRGPSPIESVLLDGHMTTGVSIMKLDKEMDHGPLLVQTAYMIPLEATAGTLEVTCGQVGGELLTQVLEPYVEGTLLPREQDHSKATICKKITKEMGEITLEDDAASVQRKFRAFTPWPGLYFFSTHKYKRIRFKVTKVTLTENKTFAHEVIERVVPEGKHEITWEDFKRGYLD